MRRSICVCEPVYALAGETKTWKFVYTTASGIPKGARLRFDLESQGRPADWEIPGVNLKEQERVIWAELPDKKPLAATALDPASFEFTLPADLKGGESLTFCLAGSRCQTTTQRKRPFHLHIDTKGKGDYKETETFHLDVRGNQLKRLRILIPSLVSRNRRFDVVVRFEDVYGNLTSNAPEGTLIELSYHHLRESFSWKLFVPETGFISLPNLYFNEAGIYTIQLRNLKTQEVFHSPPIKCLAEGSMGISWGILHGESERVNSTDEIEAYIRGMRDEKGLQFIAVSCFDSEEETSNDAWKLISQQVAESNEDDRFAVFLGFQWLGEPKAEGLHHILYAKDNKPILRRKDSKYNSLKKIVKSHTPKDLLAIPSFTMGKSTVYDFEDFQPEYERVAEIYNAWGSSECTAQEGNPMPIQSDKGGVLETPEGSLQKALQSGRRFGFVAGGYDDRGPYETLYDTDQAQYSEGLTAILSKEHTRAALFEALSNRSCYATTGEKIILGLHIAGFGMGAELDTKSRPGLEYNRHITGYAVGTTPLTRVELVRNGEVCAEFPIQNGVCDFEFDDGDILTHIALQPENPTVLPFLYYYLRVTQEGGHRAWSSPIWILQTGKADTSPIKKPKKK